MAKGRKTGGRDFQPGKPGGPGRPPIPESVKEMRRWTIEQFQLALNKYSDYTREQIMEAAKRPDLPMYDCVIVTILAKAAKGDIQAFNALADRTLPKHEKIEHSGDLSINCTVTDYRDDT